MIYLLILVVLLACMALLDARARLFLFRAPVRAALCLVAGTGFFAVWDVLAINRGIFLHVDSPLMTGIMVGPQFPLEELFFLLFLCYSSMIAVLVVPALARRGQPKRRAAKEDHVY